MASRQRDQMLAAALIAGFLLLAVGCTRRYYRLSADREGGKMILQKYTPQWGVTDLNVYADPRARFYDPYNPDRPPMPPDDPAAHAIMHRVYKINGFKGWHRNGDIAFVSNPEWEILLPTYACTTPEGKLKLDVTGAVILSRIHSPDYQYNLEEVFLSALDVAFERFRFDCQYFLTNTTTSNITGGLPPAQLGATGPGFANSTSYLNTQTNAFFKRTLATNGQLLVGIANSMAWQFAGPDTNFATSLINESFTQPLLRNGGKVVALEALTRVERNLIGNLRSLSQYKQQFYVLVAVGTQTTVAPRRIGGFQGGAGLSGFTGTGVGGFGGVGADLNFGGVGGSSARVGGSGAGGGTGLAGGGEGNVSGFYGLVQRIQAIRNTQTSIAAQVQALGLLEANFNAGLIELVQVDEFRQNIETERSALLRSLVAFQDTLESYLIGTIGLPPWLPVEIDDSIIKPFQFIDPKLTEIQTRQTELLQRTGELPREPTETQLQEVAKEMVATLTDLPAHANLIEKEIQELRAQRDKISTDPKSQVRREYLAELSSIDKTLASLKERIAEANERAKGVEARIERGQRRDLLGEIVNILRSSSSLVQEVSLLQAGIRVDMVNIKSVELSPEEAFWIARQNRFDWMNQRAALVDQWRLIAFNANKLLAGFDIQLDANIGTNGDNPARFRSPTTTATARVFFDAPITRKSERNVYRQSLIDYQRLRRAYIGYVDGVAITIRSRLRLLKRLYENLEIQRRALAISVRRVDQTLEDLNRPFAPTPPGQAPTQLGPTLSQNLLRALSDFRNTQDNFLSVWMAFQSARMNLLVDMGIFQVDDRNLWIEESIDEAVDRIRAVCPMPEPPPPPGIIYLARLESMNGFGGDPKKLLESPRLGPPLSSTPWLDFDADVWSAEAEIADSPEGSSMDLVRGGDFYEAENETPPWAGLDVESDKKTLRGKLGAFMRTIHMPGSDRSKKYEDPTMITREDFLKNLRRVGELVDKGSTEEQILEQTGLSLPAVKAYKAAIERSTLNIVEKIPVQAHDFRPTNASLPHQP